MTTAEVGREADIITRMRQVNTGHLAVLAVLSVCVAARSAAQVSVPVKSDWGLAAALPAGFWIGLLSLNVLMVIALTAARRSRSLLTLLLAALVVTLYGAPMFATGTPRGEVAWRHLGIVGDVMGSGRIDPNIDGYFNWPGFFAGLAGLTETTGISPQQIALVAPIVNVLMWLGVMAVIVRSFTTDHRHLWLSLWLFALGNWIDQDYLSPQAFAFFLYLALLAVALTTLSARPTVSLPAAISHVGLAGGMHLWWVHREPVEPDARRRVAGMAVATLLGVAIVISHQLTPFMLIAALLLLTVTGRLWSPRLVVIVGLVLIMWLDTGASTYLAGHPVLFVDGADKAVSAGLEQRISGSSGHVRVVEIRTASMLAMWSLALFGFVRLWRLGRHDIRPAVLFIAPFLMVPAQSYGGEMLLRVALFSLPFAAFYVAGLLLSAGRGFDVRVGILVVEICLAVSLSTVVARYGNARFDMFTRSEIAGSRALYRLAPDNAVLIAGAHPTPWQFENYTSFRHATIAELCRDVLADVPTCFALIEDRARHNPEGALVMLNRANQDSLRMQQDVSARAFNSLTERFMDSTDATLVYRNRDVLIFQFPPQGTSR